MKKILLCAALYFAFIATDVGAFQIVHGTGTSPEDSVCIPFFNLDSLGQNIGGLDTTRVIVFGPGGDSVFSQIIAGVAGRVKMSVDNGDSAYRWCALVDDIDGPGDPGPYLVKITAKSDQSGAWLRTPLTAVFQLGGVEFSKLADSASMARSVWNTPHNNHTITGTFGKFLDAEISGIGAGSGLYSVQIAAYDSVVHQVVPGVNMAIRNLSQTALIALGTTGVQGAASFNLSADTFLIVPFSPGYIFQAFDTAVVNGAAIDTVYGYRFDPGHPATPDLCRLYGFLYDIGGHPQSDASVSASLPSGVCRTDGTIISPFKIETTTDSAGYFFMDLIPSTHLVPDTIKYEITITRTDGTILRERVIIPDSTDWLLSW